MQKIVIDTDVGTDADDLFALTYALRNPNCSLGAISTVIGDTVVRAKIVRKLERMLGTNVPIIAGEKGSDESVKKYWTGIEEKALTEEESAETFTNSPYPEYTQDTKLICIGPLTNIALQLDNNPTIRNVKDIYVMGSSNLSHNFKADIEACKKVYEESWNIYQITKEISERVLFTREELEKLRATLLGEFLYSSTIRWLDYTKRRRARMYDVLTVSAGIGEGYVRFEEQEKGRFLSHDVDIRLKDKLIEEVRK